MKPLLLPNQPPQMTFVLHDAGETKALMPVMQQLDSMGVNYSILADSTAKVLLQGNPCLAPLPRDIAVLSKTQPQAVQQAKFRLTQAINVPCIVSGLASSFQHRWTQFFRRQGKTVVGYYDGFGYNPLHNRVDAFIGHLSSLIVPSRDIANFLRPRFYNIPVLALGQPVLETGPRLIQQTNRVALAQQLGIASSKPTILFVGGYGEGYEQAFHMFCQTVVSLPAANLLVALHPKTDGYLETSLLRKYGLENRVRIVPKTTDTVQAMGVSDIILSHHSTMTIQALLEGKKVFLLGDIHSKIGGCEFNPAIYYGISRRYLTPFALVQAIQSELQCNLKPSANKPQQKDLFYAQLGIPKQATVTITNYLLNLLPVVQRPLNRAA